MTPEDRRRVEDVIRAHSGCADPDCNPETCSIRRQGLALVELLRAHDEEAKQEREWALMREDRDQFERRALAAEEAQQLLQEALQRRAAEVAELQRMLREERALRDERVAFIRQAVIALKTAHWPSGQVLAAGACWREAGELWDAKPEDC